MLDYVRVRRQRKRQVKAGEPYFGMAADLVAANGRWRHQRRLRPVIRSFAGVASGAKRTLGLAVAALALGAVPSAHAGEVFLESRRLSFVADAGEANALRVVLAASAGSTRSGEATITDTGAPIRTSAGCRSLTPETVTCPFRTLIGVEIYLGDGNDAARVGGSFVAVYDEFRIDGGLGADTISVALVTGRDSYPPLIDGDDGDDTLLGSPSADYFAAGAGNDTVRAGAGRDQIEPNDGDDRIHGGRGTDSLDMTTAYDVAVNLTTGTATTGEMDGGVGHDRVTGIENVLGAGEGTNVLIGDEGPNRLYGGDLARDRLDGKGGADFLSGGYGADFLAGSAGRDRLDGGGNRDRVHGGGGNDTLLARDGSRDQLSGGRGRDCARVDSGLDRLQGIETVPCGRRASALA